MTTSQQIGKTTSQTPAYNRNHMLSFDLETTGVNPLEARIVTSALIEINGGDKKDRELLANPGVEIPKAASDVHGITTEYAKEHGQAHDKVLQETINTLYNAWDQGASVVVYNAAYDLSILKALDPTFEIRGPVIDPFVIDMAKDKYRKGKRTLTATAEHYNVPLDNAHEATADAVASARVAWVLGSVYPELLEMTEEELMMAQAQWFKERQDEMAAWHAKQGRSGRDSNDAWPLHKALLG